MPVFILVRKQQRAQLTAHEPSTLDGNPDRAK